jgi:hypothetical protein
MVTNYLNVLSTRKNDDILGEGIMNWIFITAIVIAVAVGDGFLFLFENMLKYYINRCYIWQGVSF